jgi:hypothetical protein
LCSDLLIFIYQGVFLPLDHVGFPQKSWIKKVCVTPQANKALEMLPHTYIEKIIIGNFGRVPLL